MSYLDLQALLSDAQAYTATAVSTNAYDTKTATNDIGVGEPICVVFSIDVAADFTTGDETYVFTVISSAASALSAPTVLATRTLLATTLVAGYKFFLPIPGGKTQRWIGTSLTLAGTTPSVTVTAGIKAQKEAEEIRTYPKGYTIS